MSTMSDDLRARVPAHLLADIEDLTRLVTAVDGLAEELGRRLRRLVAAWEHDADWRKGDRALTEDERDDFDEHLADAAGLTHLMAAIGVVRARLDDGAVPDSRDYLAERGFTGIGVTER